ncbi:hypothetical protein AB0M02_21765 [Actinoplanes sp. NPDC051861]|uniref:hypothetical protein n=1 Tax=Actinoplanes sp. NPDC051861 TaxID=3155170 RepID=UPI003432BF05
MTTANWPRTDPALERAYRRLLRAYPGSYRRRHGTEIVTTLLEMAEPGQQRPGRSETWHLIASGIRQRFRVPARPLALIAAVLALLAGGGLGAAAGSWVSERTFADVPGPEQTLVLVGTLVPPPGAQEMTAQGEDGTPWFGAMTRGTARSPGIGQWDSDAARQRLAADGWRLGPVSHPHSTAQILDKDGKPMQVLSTMIRFQAERDGVRMQVTAYLDQTSGRVTTELWAIGNASLLPLIVAGALAGMAGGWLFAAAATHRMRHTDRSRRWAAATLGTAAALSLAPPVTAFYGNVIRAFEFAGGTDPVFTVHSALSPTAHWPFGAPWLNLAALTAGLLLATTMLLMLAPAHHEPAPEPRPTTN